MSVSRTGWRSKVERLITFNTSLGRRLLVQGFDQIAVAFLQFFEQPHVLDGDHRLSRKCLKQLDLLVGERTDLRSANVIVPMGTPRAATAWQALSERPHL